MHIIQHTYISHGMLSKLAAKRHFAQLRNLFLRLMLRLPALGRRAPVRNMSRLGRGSACCHVSRALGSDGHAFSQCHFRRHLAQASVIIWHTMCTQCF